MTDAELIDQTLRGNPDAFGELVDRHRSAVFRAARAALGSVEDAEEAAQEAFVTAFRKLASFRGESSFKTWLLSIAWRAALDLRRSLRVRLRRFVSTGPLEEKGWDVPDHGRTQEVAAVDAEQADRIRRLVRRLPPKLRDPLLLYASGDHTYGEIASLLALPVGTVKWRVMEARRQLRERLAGLGYGNE